MAWTPDSEKNDEKTNGKVFIFFFIFSAFQRAAAKGGFYQGVAFFSSLLIPSSREGTLPPPSVPPDGLIALFTQGRGP